MTQPVTRQRDTAGWFRHPRGLSTLFFTEMWERFSFYGLKALLILFMTATVAQGGLGFTAERGGAILGWYGFGVYATANLCGWGGDPASGQNPPALPGAVNPSSPAFRPGAPPRTYLSSRTPLTLNR